MKTNRKPDRARRGASLLEIAGVIAIVAVLASMLWPVVYRAVDDARLVSDVQTIANVRLAVGNYYKKYGKFGMTNGLDVAAWVNNAYENWDVNTLLPERFIETRLRCHLATNAFVRLLRVANTSSSASILNSGSFGSLGTWNGNNGYYDLEDQYAWASPAGAGGPVYVRRAPAPPPGGQVAATPAWCRTLAPFLACYDVPTNWNPPPAVPGGQDGGGNPRHNITNPTSSYWAPDSAHPIIVSEIVMQGVHVGDAYRLSMMIDGFVQSRWAFYDTLGQVKYDMYDTTGTKGVNVGTVYIYLGRVPPR